MKEMKEIVRFVEDLCAEHNAKLLYLSKFGSHLYGTDGPNSDIDYKGIFLPSKKDMLLGRHIKHIKYNTGIDARRNTSDDLDVDLWSLQYFLELIGKGETNAIDLLFSVSHRECVEYIDSHLIKMFSNPLRLFDPSRTRAYTGYTIGQAKKYGIKGSRLGVIKKLHEFIINTNLHKYHSNLTLGNFVDSIVENFGDPLYCFLKMINGELALVVCGKVHLLSIKMHEFAQRIVKEYEKYGKRAKEAEQNKGVDWKALSHAVRALRQMNELLATGEIKYPLRSAEELINIKKGNLSFEEIEKLIRKGLEVVDNMQETGFVVRGNKDTEFINQIILNAYRRM